MLGEQEHDELVMSLVESVLKHPPEERAARLQALCRDPTIHEEARKYIEWEERMGGFLLDPLLQQPPGRARLPGRLLPQRAISHHPQSGAGRNGDRL